MIRGGDAAVTEVVTSFPGHCLGAMESCKEILKDLKEGDEENSFSGSSWKFEEKL